MTENRQNQNGQNEKVQNTLKENVQNIPDENGQDKSRQKRRNKRIWTVVFILINIAVIAATAINEFSGKPAGSIDLRFTKSAFLYLVCTALCFGVLLMTETLKYMLMMRSLREPVSFRIAFETAALGKYYDCITPSGAGGQPFQILWLHRHGYSDGGASAMTITDYVTAQAGFILLALVIFITWRSVELEAIRYTAYFGLLLFSLIPFLLVLFSFMPKTIKKLVSAVIRFCGKLKLVKHPDETTAQVIDRLNSYHTSLNVIVKDKLTGFSLLLLSLLYRVALCSMPFFVLKMFGAQVNFLRIFASTIYIYASIALVPTPGNAGAAEGAFYLVFSAMGSDGVFWAMLIWRLFSHYAFILTGALVYGANALRRRKEGRLPQRAEGGEPKAKTIEESSAHSAESGEPAAVRGEERPERRGEN